MNKLLIINTKNPFKEFHDLRKLCPCGVRYIAGLL